MKSRTVSLVIAVCAAVFCAAPSFGQVEVVVFDGFGDADLNNDGRALQENDTDEGSYIPNKFGMPDPNDPEGEIGPEVNYVDSVLDANDTGIAWFSTRGFTSNGLGDEKALIRIFDDSPGAFPGTDPSFSNATALDTGYAVGFEGKGRGSSIAGFFGRSVELGPIVGDQVKAGFDFRVWQSAPNTQPFNPPEFAELRWGLFQDTDGQIGMTNPLAGRKPDASSLGTPAVWGEENGHFRGELGADGNVDPAGGPNAIGAGGDHGWWTRIDIGDETASFGPLPGGQNARINEETNEFIPAEDRPLDGNGLPVAGDTNRLKFMEGSDADFVTRPDMDNPDFTSLLITDTYRLELTLERATNSVDGDTILATYDVTNLLTGTTWTLSGQETELDANDAPDGISSDSWDYIALRNTGADDFDFMFDNVSVEIIGSNAMTMTGLACDAGGASECDINDLNALYDAFGSGGGQFDYDGNGTVGPEDISGWLAEASTSDNTANAAGDTFMTGDVNLDGDVNSTDLGLLLNNFGADAGVQWGDGDLNGSGGVDSTDLGLMLNNFGFASASAAAAVPEPSSCLLMLFGLLMMMGWKRS